MPNINKQQFILQIAAVLFDGSKDDINAQMQEQPVQNICLVTISDGSFCSEQVPREESIAEVRDRYMDINGHAASYNWKALKWQGSEV